MLIEYTQNRLSSGIDDGCSEGERCVGHSVNSLEITATPAAGAVPMSVG